MATEQTREERVNIALAEIGRLLPDRKARAAGQESTEAARQDYAALVRTRELLTADLQNPVAQTEPAPADC